MTRRKDLDRAFNAQIDAAGKMSLHEFRDAMDVLGFSLDGMAARLGVARRLIAAYRTGYPIPKAVALATRWLMMRREPQANSHSSNSEWELLLGGPSANGADFEGE